VKAQQGPGSAGSGFGAGPTQSIPYLAAPLGAAIEPGPIGVVAFVGRALKGPVNEAVPVESFAQFQQRFGGLWSDSLLPHAVEQFFEHGGRQAVIVRVVSSARWASSVVQTTSTRVAPLRKSMSSTSSARIMFLSTMSSENPSGSDAIDSFLSWFGSAVPRCLAAGTLVPLGCSNMVGR